METVELAAGGCDLDATLCCGQCFRWTRRPDGGWTGVAAGVRLTVRRRGDRLVFEGPGVSRRRARLAEYFDLGRGYAALHRLFSADPALRRAVEFAPGLRLLRQEPWETLASFVLSQNNNIVRLRGMVERLCGLYGEPTPGGGRAFPTPERLSALKEADLAPLRSGYRAGYLLDAARRVASGKVDLAAARTMPVGEAREMMRSIRGVGPKVADCALLYGCGRLECVPVDVWIRRALTAFYPGGLPEAVAPVAGIAQLYLFHYVRHLGGRRAGGPAVRLTTAGSGCPRPGRMPEENAERVNRVAG